MKYNNRILHVVGAMNMGGQETFIMNIYRKIDTNKCQFDFSVVTQKESIYDKEIKKLGGNIYHITSSGENRKKYYKEIYTLFKQYNIIHIHTDSARIVFLVWIAKLAKCKKIIVHAHSTNCRNVRTHQITKKLLYITPNIIRLACGEKAGRWIYGKRKFEIVPNGIDMDKYQFKTEIRKNKREELKIQDKYVVGHVGRFCEAKNHIKIINVFEKIINLNTNAVLLLIGIGEEQEKIKQMVKEKGLEQKVFFLNNRNDVHELLQAMDVMIFPSLYEGLSIALIEAQTTGLPIVCSDKVTRNNDISGLIRFVNLQKDNESWAKYVLQATSNEREIFAPKLKQTPYDIYKVVNRIQKIYKGKE